MLETKSEELNVGMQSALEGASLAESKCSALGAELVKVFRMLASSRKESPTKMMMGDGPEEENEQHHPQHRSRCVRSHQAGHPKSKTISSHAACTYCKRAAMKGSNEVVECVKEHLDADHVQPDTLDNTLLEGHKAGYYYDGSNSDNMSPSMDRGYKESGPQGKPLMEGHDITHARAYHGGEDLLLEKANRRNAVPNDKSHHRKGELMEKLEDFEALEHLLAKKNLSAELKTYEGKLPITHEKLDDKRIECSKKDVTNTGSGKNCSSTNIRLDAGKIQVNVSHRSAATLSGSRMTKRGDAISVRP